MDSFADKIVLVTGATSGIGRATALAFGRGGAVVAVLGRRADAGEQTAAQVRAAGGRAAFLRVDIAVEAEVEGAVAEIVARHGRLDIAANCAGADPPATLAESTPALFDTVFDANVRGLFHCLKHQLAAMHPRRAGAIVTVGSIAAQRPDPANALYCASKSAARMLTQAAAIAAAADGIRINEVAPGPIDTPMLQNYLRRAAASGRPITAVTVAAAAPLGRIGTAEEVAEAILFLCSDRAGFVTGACLSVDGGFGIR